jgi:hypothetical protein
MKEPYVPPEMPPFLTDEDRLLAVLAPYYYRERPFDFLFEMFVVDVIDVLPERTRNVLNEFSREYPTFFEGYGSDWRKCVVDKLQLSDTIEIAIWDLWICNSDIAESNGWKYHPWNFAQNFVEIYLADGSRVDVWEGNSLAQAKTRIRKYRRDT